MEIKKEKEGDVLIVNVSGRLDTATCGDFEGELLPSIDDGEHNVLIDCTTLDYISSAGLRVFLTAAKKMKRVQGKIAICGVKKEIEIVFDISGFSAFFPMFSSRKEGLQDFTN